MNTRTMELELATADIYHFELRLAHFQNYQDDFHDLLKTGMRRREGIRAMSMASLGIKELRSALPGKLEPNVTQLVRGATIAEYSVLNKTPCKHMYSAIALVPTQCLAIGRSAYAKMCELQPEFEDVVKK